MGAFWEPLLGKLELLRGSGEQAGARPSSCPRGATTGPAARGEPGFVPMLLSQSLPARCVVLEIIIVCIKNAGCTDIFRVIKLQR